MTPSFVKIFHFTRPQQELNYVKMKVVKLREREHYAQKSNIHKVLIFGKLRINY